MMRQRPSALRDFALVLLMAIPAFLAACAVVLAIPPIADARWRLVGDDATLSLGLVSVGAYLLTGLVVSGCSADPDVGWGGCSIVIVCSLGTLLPIWIGFGPLAADQSLAFRAVLWLQPLLAVGGYLLGASLVRLIRRARAAPPRSLSGGR